MGISTITYGRCATPLLVLLLAACPGPIGPSTGTSSGTKSPKPSKTEAISSPSPTGQTPSPGGTPSPSATPTGPASVAPVTVTTTPTPSATAPGTPTPTQTPSGTPSGTPTPVPTGTATATTTPTAQTVSTLAGNGEAGWLDEAAAAAKFNGPEGLVLDGAGNLFVADAKNHRIRKIVLATGAVSTYAGIGTPGVLDAVNPLLASFSVPTALARAANGDLYVADTGNDRIRKIAGSGGIVTTVAGDMAGLADGVGTLAQFTSPRGLALDGSGNLFVADSFNGVVRKIALATADVSTFAGGGSQGTGQPRDGTGDAAKFGTPFGLAIDAANKLAVLESTGNALRQITPAAVVTTLAGLSGSVDGDVIGPLAGAKFAFSNIGGAIAFGATGVLYVADGGNHKIKKVSASTVDLVAGDGTRPLPANPTIGSFAEGPAATAKFNRPLGIAVDISTTPPTIYVADTNNNRIRKIK